MLAALCRNSFASRVRHRGEDYFRKGRVRLHEVSEGRASAVVSGSREYAVSLGLDPQSDDDAPTVIVSCECPYFADTRVACKHLWATILAVESKKLAQFLGGMRLRGALDLDSFENDGPDNEDADAPDREDMLDEEDEFGDVSFLRPPAGWSRSKPVEPWKQALRQLKQQHHAAPRYANDAWTQQEELLYAIAPPVYGRDDGIVVQVQSRRPRKAGGWCKPRLRPVSEHQAQLLSDPQDRYILALLTSQRSGYDYYSSYSRAESQFTLGPAMQEILLPLLCRTGRFCMVEGTPLAWDEGRPWELSIEVAAPAPHYTIKGVLTRGAQKRKVEEALRLVHTGWVIWPDSISRLKATAKQWVQFLGGPAVAVPQKHGQQLVEELSSLPQLPPLVLPPQLQYEPVNVTPKPCLKIRGKQAFSDNYVTAELGFDYVGVYVSSKDESGAICQKKTRRLIRRDPEAEAKAMARLTQAGFTVDYSRELCLPLNKLPAVVADLLREDWRVEAEGALYRRPTSHSASVSSGIDWFDLHGEVNYDGVTISLPAMLEALRKNEPFVRLGDGSFGMLPEEWLQKFGMMARLGEAKGDAIRFKPSQAMFLDSLLAAQPEVNCDATFSALRKQIATFTSVQPGDAPDTFIGTLRQYQREGLGWMTFLRSSRLGGFLADDMGLGKTIQVLAMLEALRLESGRGLGVPAVGDAGILPASKSQVRGQDARVTRPRPTLVVAPRSLIFNWMNEAASFTPQLRVLDYTGLDRDRHDTKAMAAHDLVLTTYGTLRQDIQKLKDVGFHYAILDEAQAIKNASTASAKAVRLLKAEHRLCLSGTPIENHLGELWSQFEFLNPGMLGRTNVFNGGSDGRNLDDGSKAMLSRALRPFILRRTKSQVAKDLPSRTEMTLQCQLDPQQRKIYNDLRDYYRQSLLTRVSDQGMNKSKIQVLEALLRLRQAACHPGLIDKAYADVPSAKLDTLMAQLSEVTQEGHKALVFSQFTSFLALVRKQLEATGVVYEYLDGKTRDREARVQRFQSDENCGVFLISLKDGGLGLNLTAAEYVFLLDPWWNPAVEAQAIDRAHRIGQQRQVFAYRLIASDTVEQRVLELQQTKRELADAILGNDKSLLQDLKPEDLALLLT